MLFSFEQFVDFKYVYSYPTRELYLLCAVNRISVNKHAAIWKGRLSPQFMKLGNTPRSAVHNSFILFIYFI